MTGSSTTTSCADSWGRTCPPTHISSGSSSGISPSTSLSRLVRIANDDDWVEHVEIGQAAVAIASTFAVVATFYVCWRLIRELGLPGGPGAILLTVFGSPLFYYGIFQTGLKHAFDALLVTSLALLLLRSTLRPPTTRLAVLIGLVLALLITVRYANIVLLVGVVYIFARRRLVSHAYVAALSATVGGTVILALPLVLGIPYGFPPNEPVAILEPVGASIPAGESPVRLAAAFDVKPIVAASGVDDVSSYDVDVLAPVKMLFTIRRGLFVWTPLTLFGVIGYLLFLRREPRHRVFLVGLGLSALALLLVHMVWGDFWFGGYSFSQRFLTGLFPLFAIGIAELLARTRMLVTPLLLACIAWTAFLALHHFYGYDFVSYRDGADRIVELYRTGEETNERFWHERVRGPIARHWEAYLDWAGLYSRSRAG